MKSKSVWKGITRFFSLMIGLCVLAPGQAQAASQLMSAQDFNLQDFGSPKRAQFVQWGIMDSDRYQLESVTDSVTPTALYAEVLGRSLVHQNDELSGSRLFFSLVYKGSLLGLIGRASLTKTMSCQSCFLNQSKQQQYGVGVFLHQEARYVFIRAMLSGNWLYEPNLLQRVIDQLSQKTPRGTDNRAMAKELIKTFKLQSSFNYGATLVLGAHAYLPFDLRISPQLFAQFGAIQESGTRSSTLKWGAYLSLAYLDTGLLQVDAQTGVAYVYHLGDDIRPTAIKAWYHRAQQQLSVGVQHDDIEYSLMVRAQAHPLPNLSLGLFLGYDHYQKSNIRQLQYGGNLTLSF